MISKRIIDTFQAKGVYMVLQVRKGGLDLTLTFPRPIAFPASCADYLTRAHREQYDLSFDDLEQLEPALRAMYDAMLDAA